MRILSIQGSPRHAGNTASVLAWVEDELNQAGHTVEHVELCELELRPCLEDLSCQEVYDRPGCAINDDGHAIYDQMLAAEMIILASPLFCWSFTAQMKTLIDRLICMCKVFDLEAPVFLLQNKRFALVSTAAGPEEGNMDLIAETFDRFVEYTHAVSAGKLLIGHCTAPRALGPDIQKRARTFAQEITSPA